MKLKSGNLEVMKYEGSFINDEQIFRTKNIKIEPLSFEGF
jgi:hypothetical protein